MDVHSFTINKVFSSGGDIQYILPYFQREYAWEKENWQVLVTDVMSIYGESNVATPEHFMGAIVVIDDGTRSGTMTAFKLVDGQQRLTTLSLFLCALADNVNSDQDADLIRKIRKLLVNPDEKGILHYKIIPTQKYNNRQAYFAIIDGKDYEIFDSRIVQAYNYFKKQISLRISQEKIDVNRLFQCVVQYMHVVFINLNQRERPYEIFESLNAKGKPLTQPDLVRNYIAMRLPSELQEQVFEQYWVQIEEYLQESRNVSGGTGELTAFLRHYLSHIVGVLPNKGHVYARFRDRMESEFATVEDFVEEIKKLYQFGTYYNKLLRPEFEDDSQIQAQLLRLNILEVVTAYPFLMFVYDLYTRNTISRNQFVEILQMIENYMLRRHLAGEQTGYVARMFPTLRREVSETNIVESVRNALLTKHYPSDDKLRQILFNNPLYNKRKQRRIVFVFETINRYLSRNSGGHTVLDSNATIEHIMPQTMTEEWKAHIGSNWDETHKEHLHILGNLTIVTQEWNSFLSNSSFIKKRENLANHALRLNSDYFSPAIEKWDSNSIQKRSEFLVENILEIWTSFGDPPQTVDVTGTKPTSLVVLGEVFEVNSWRDVAFQMAEIVSQLAADFDLVAHELDSFFKREDDWNSSRQLSNGWWLNVNLSGNSVVNFCERITAIVGLSEDDWEFTNG